MSTIYLTLLPVMVGILVILLILTIIFALLKGNGEESAEISKPVKEKESSVDKAEQGAEIGGVTCTVVLYPYEIR